MEMTNQIPYQIKDLFLSKFLNFKETPKFNPVTIYDKQALTIKSAVYHSSIKQYYQYYHNPSTRAGYDTRSIFKQSLAGLNSEFSFS